MSASEKIPLPAAASYRESVQGADECRAQILVVLATGAGYGGQGRHFNLRGVWRQPITARTTPN